MNSNPGAVGALILVPIAIAGSVAFIAIKTTDICHKAVRLCRALFPCSRRQRRKRHRSDLPISQVYADSWCDLESTLSREGNNIIQPSPTNGSLSRVWHPHRLNRLTWSFGKNPESRNQNHLESSKTLQRPLPAIARPERSQSQVEELQDQGMPLDRHQMARTHL